MPDVILWENDGGGVAICMPTGEVDVVPASVVPDGKPYIVMSDADLPDVRYSAAWSIRDGSLVVDEARKALIDNPPKPTPEEKLAASTGLTVHELRSLIGK